jgi:hypothetical protein
MCTSAAIAKDMNAQSKKSGERILMKNKLKRFSFFQKSDLWRCIKANSIREFSLSFPFSKSRRKRSIDAAND